MPSFSFPPPNSLLLNPLKYHQNTPVPCLRTCLHQSLVNSLLFILHMNHHRVQLPRERQRLLQKSRDGKQNPRDPLIYRNRPKHFIISRDGSGGGRHAVGLQGTGVHATLPDRIGNVNDATSANNAKRNNLGRCTEGTTTQLHEISDSK